MRNELLAQVFISDKSQVSSTEMSRPTCANIVREDMRCASSDGPYLGASGALSHYSLAFHFDIIHRHSAFSFTTFGKS